jgi:hypothetical protein
MADGGETGAITLESIGDISTIAAKDWDSCAAPEALEDGRPLDPFTTHRFLHALEASGSATPQTGWGPRHMIARDGEGRVLGVMPLYLKSHSQGEYVFDHCLGACLGTRRRRLLPQAAERRALHAGHRPAPSRPPRRRARDGRGRAAAGRRDALPAQRPVLDPHHLLHRSGMAARRRTGAAATAGPAIPLGEPRLRRFRRLPRRSRQPQAQADPQGARDGGRGGVEILRLTGEAI